MKKIILVDDDEFIQHIVKLIFEDFDFQVTIYPDGESLLNNEFEVPDVFILDRQLPGINGLDLCRLLKNNSSTRHIPTIMVSASKDIISVSKQAGVTIFIEKPFPIKKLREAVFKTTRSGH